MRKKYETNITSRCSLTGVTCPSLTVHQPCAPAGYNDLQHRKETRESAWLRPGWDECVAHTVPLIGGMQSRILWANPFSPTQ